MSGTLLSDLDSSPSSSDDNAVQRILTEMNGGPSPPPPQLQVRQPQAPAQVMNAPNPNSTMQYAMDNQPATAHVIGMDHPTNADFTAMMYNQRGQQQQQFAPAMRQGGQGGQGMQGMQQGQQQQWNMQPPNNYPSKSYTSDLMKELKTPLLVSLLIFVFSLPVINIMVSHYFPSFVKGTGELTTVGLIIKSLLAGGAFWILQRIVAPLLVGY